MLESKSTVEVVVLIFLKHNGVWESDRYKLFLQRGINTAQGFSCTLNAVFMHVKYIPATPSAVRNVLKACKQVTT